MPKPVVSSVRRAAPTAPNRVWTFFYGTIMNPVLMKDFGVISISRPIRLSARGPSDVKPIQARIRLRIRLAGMILDSNYQRSTPELTHVQGTVVGFERPQRKQVYPILEFKDTAGSLHRVVNPTQQAMVRFAAGDAVPIAYSRSDPQRARIDTFWFNHRWVMGASIVALTLVLGALLRRQSTST